MLPADHKSKAERNAAFSEWVLQNRHESNDWSLTGYFYTALHLMQTFLEGQRQHPTTHKDRNRLIVELAASGIIPPDQADNYICLYNLSRTARYDSVETDRAELEEILAYIYCPLDAWLRAQLGP